MKLRWLVPVVALLAAGCIKEKTLVVVNADGSGTLVLDTALTAEAVAMMKQTAASFAGAFGDATTALGATSTPFPVQTVTPNGTFSGVSSPDLSDATAVFPMDVVNNGQYNDSFTLSGSVTFTDAATNNTVTVPVLYYAPDGSLLPRVSNDPASAEKQNDKSQDG